MRIFTKYLIKRSFITILIVLLIFTFLDLLFNLISDLENVSQTYSFMSSLKYVLLSAPYRSITFLEASCLLGTIVALGISQLEGNLNVLRSSGMSPFKIVSITSISALFISLFFLSLNEISFNKIYLDAKIDRDENTNKTSLSSSDLKWIKDGDSFLGYTHIYENIIYNPMFIKKLNNEIQYAKKADTAEFEDSKLTFLNNYSFHEYILSNADSKKEEFTLPYFAKVNIKNVNNLSLKKLLVHNKNVDANNIYNDNLLKKHLQKAIYEILFAPISIFILIVFCGSYIFGSLRESNPSSKIIFAVIVSFLYKTTQDFSISFFISYNLPLIIGVILPSTLVGLIAINLYKKI